MLCKNYVFTYVLYKMHDCAEVFRKCKLCGVPQSFSCRRILLYTILINAFRIIFVSQIFSKLIQKVFDFKKWCERAFEMSTCCKECSIFLSNGHIYQLAWHAHSPHVSHIEKTWNFVFWHIARDPYHPASTYEF